MLDVQSFHSFFLFEFYIKHKIIVPSIQIDEIIKFNIFSLENAFITTLSNTQMRRIINPLITRSLFNPLPHYRFYKPKPDQPTPPTNLKHSMFNKKSFPQIINIIKNPDNPYPKNSAYFYAILECILDQSNENAKIMLDHGEVIHVFLQEIMDRIKTMGSKELSEILALNKFRPKALRFDKELLITMHVRFESRINELIDLNEKSLQGVNPQQKLSMQDIRNQIQGLFYLKKNTNILNKVLRFSYNILLHSQQHPNPQQPQQLLKQQHNFFAIIQIINQNLDDTIDPVRQSIADFILQHHKKHQLPRHKQILRMMVKCKFYKNYPIVRNEDWMHEYVYGYLKEMIERKELNDIEEFVSVLKSVTTYVMHIDPQSYQGFVSLVQQGYHLAKSNLLAVSYINDKQQLSREVNTISHQIKLIPSYLYLKHYYQISTTDVRDGNKVDNRFIQKVIDQIKPIIKKFVLCYFDKSQIVGKDGKEGVWLTGSVDQNIDILNNIIKNQQQPQKLLLKSVQNLLNTVTVFKDYNIINADVQFSLLLVQTQIIYCILCRYWISDQVRYLRLLQHAVFVIGQLDRQIHQGNKQIISHSQRIQRIRAKLQDQLSIYDNMDKTYKQFTVLRLVAVLRCMKMKPKYLGDFYRNVKMKKPNIYVETLSRTMLKSHNYKEVIQAFDLMFEGKIQVKQIELGRIVFLSSKQPQLLKYWMHTNRQLFVNKICFCRRIINNIVSIIRMDNLQINRNSIQLLAEIVIQNKLYQIDNHSISNHQQSNQLKKILCNNFSILFRYSKMDSMIDDIFVVHKNIPTIFRNHFSHIQAIKILSFSSYLSQQQSIFYINRQNKNALFKYVIMLMKKSPYCQKRREHYLLGKAYNQQDMMLTVMNKIIEQYWPDNKLTNKGMPFYCQFLTYFTQINKFELLIRNQNTIFLIIKQILQDYKLIQTHSQLKHLISRIQHNYQRLHFLSILQAQTQISNTLQNVTSSMNFTMDMKIFGEFGAVVEGWIKKEIGEERIKREKGQVEKGKEWREHDVDRHLVNVLAVEKVENVQNVSDYQILSLMTVEVLSHGIRATINHNMPLLIRRLLKVNPLSAKLSHQQSPKKKFPFQLFKLIMSNLNIYTQNRLKRQLLGKQIIPQDISHQKISQWMIKCLLTYSREIQNNQQLDNVMAYMSSWGVDVLALIRTKFLEPKISLPNLCANYFSVEILALLFSQNIIRFNKQHPHPQNELSNQKLVLYIKTLLKQMQQTHLMNNYGVYFQQDGQLVLNIIKALLMGILQTDSNAKTLKEVNHCLKHSKDLLEQFTKISNKTYKYNRLRSGGKYSYLYNEDQGQVVDMLDKKPKRFMSQDTPDVSSKNLKHISMFSQILQIMTLIKLNKWSAKNLSQQHLALIKKINTTINKKQKALLIDSELTYFTDTQPLLQQKHFQQFGLKLYIKKSTSPNTKLTAYYLINQKQSLLYDFSFKKRRRLTGQQQLVIDFIESLVNWSSKMEGDKGEKDIEIRILPNHLSKVELKKLITG